MRIVATSDTHFPVDVKLIPDGDVFIHAGDLLSMGTPDEWNANLDWLTKLPHRTKLYVPGNHDFHVVLYPGPAVQQMREAGFIVLGLPNNEYQSVTLENGMSVLGLPYVKNLDRWCFNTTEQELHQNILSKMSKHDIIVSHSPIYGILDKEIRGNYTGFQEYTQYLITHNPKYWIHGHVHEQYGTATLGNTKIFNVSMCNRSKQHVHMPVIIDV